jgi:hypothetical protein
VHDAGRRSAAAVLAATTVATVVAVAVAGASALPFLAADPAAATDPTDATTLYHEAIAATHGWSVHYASQATVSGATIVESGDAGPASGTQTVQVGKSAAALTDDATIIVIGSITYLKGNAAALGDLAGMSPTQAAEAAGQWVEFATDNATLSSVSAGVRSTDVAKELALTGPLTLRPARTLRGTHVDGVEGTQKVGGTHIRVVLYVRAAGTHVPVEEEAVNAAGKPDGVLHVVYSKWGEMVRPRAPQAAGSIGPVSSV